ncbi:MAG: XdhC family protein [Chloroflexota bacterium]
MSGPGEFHASLRQSLVRDADVAVATIVRTRGSSPREVGARMLVRRDGASDGTVGGGCGEAEVWRAALDVLSDDQARMVEVDLTNDIAINTDGVCGGIMDIFVEAWHSHDTPMSDGVLQAVADRRVAVTASVVRRPRGYPISLGEKVLVVDGQVRAGGISWPALQARISADIPSVIGGARSQQRSYRFNPTGTPDVSRDGEVAVFFDVVVPKPTLVVVGAGHVAVPIAQIGRMLDFDVVVVGDRPSFANAERFPGASEIIVDDFVAALQRLEITPTTAIVLVTRGHTHDVHALRFLVGKTAGYIGMIGSRRRVYAVFKLLRDEGFAVDDLLKVHAPIGLDIKTETPGEIAISVGAELLKARRGGGAASMSDLLRPQYRYSLSRGDDDISPGE